MLAQTNPNFTVFAVDDGSPDRSGEILDEYAKKDPRFIVIHQTNGGVSTARNTALKMIEKKGSYSYISFIDPDDYVSPKYVERFLDELKKNEADYAVCSYQPFTLNGTLKRIQKPAEYKILDGDGTIRSFWGINADHKRSTTTASSYFLNNKVFRAQAIYGKRFNEDLKSGEDFEFICRSLSSIKKGVVIPDNLFFYRLRKSSCSHGDTAFNSKVLPIIEDLYNERNSFSKSFREGLQNEYINLWLRELNYILASTKSLQEKHLFFNKCKAKFKTSFEFPLPERTQRRLGRLNLGFFFYLIYTKYTESRKRKKTVNLINSYFP